MQTWVRTVGFVRNEPDTDNYGFIEDNCYVPLSTATSIVRCYDIDDLVSSSTEDMDDFKTDIRSEIHAALNGFCVTCKCEETDCIMAEFCALRAKYAPYYFARVKCKDDDHPWIEKGKFAWYLIHPDERERMERILNGTDNPLYDLVHQLMYNPDVLPAEMIRSRREAKEHFEEQKKRKIE